MSNPIVTGVRVIYRSATLQQRATVGVTCMRDGQQYGGWTEIAKDISPRSLADTINNLLTHAQSA